MARPKTDHGQARARQGLALRLFVLIVGVCAAFVTPSQTVRAGDERAAVIPALPSRHASETLLVGLAQAGRRLVAVGAHGLILLSDDDGAHWRQSHRVPTQAMLTAVSFLDARRGFAVGHDAVVLATNDGGETWSLQYVDTVFGNPLLTVLALDEKRVLAMGALGLVLETNDGGRQWVERPLRQGDVGDMSLNKLLRADDGLYVLSEFGTVYRSTDGGRRFEDVQAPTAAAFWDGLVLSDGGLIVCGTAGEIWRATAGLRRWQRVESGTKEPIAGLGRTLDGRLVAVGLGGYVGVAAPGARRFVPLKWSKSVTPLPDFAAVAPGPRGQVVVLGEAGIAWIDDGSLDLYR